VSDTDNVGEGWRELRVGEVVQIGDEFFNETGWHVTTIGGVQLGPKNFPYRRRVTPESKHVVVPAASTPLEAMPLPASQVTHGNGYRQNNPDAGDAWRDVRSE